jgi:hypothetical protein
LPTVVKNSPIEDNSVGLLAIEFGKVKALFNPYFARVLELKKMVPAPGVEPGTSGL